MPLTLSPTPSKSCGHGARDVHVHSIESKRDGEHAHICPHCWRHHGLEAVAKFMQTNATARGHLLADGIRKALAAAPAEKPDPKQAAPTGERWITVHPHGDDEKGYPVLIKQNHDKSWSIHGGAGGSLNGLRLTNVKTPEEYRTHARQQQKAKLQQQKQEKQQQFNASVDKHRSAVQQEYEQQGKNADTPAIEDEALARARADRDAEQQQRDDASAFLRNLRTGHEQELIQTVANAQGWKPEDYQLQDEHIEAARQSLQEQHLAASKPLREAIQNGTPAQKAKAQKMLSERVEADVNKVVAAHHQNVLARAREVLDNHRNAVLAASDDLAGMSGDLSVGDLAGDTLGDSGKGYAANLAQQAGQRGMALDALQATAQELQQQALLERHGGSADKAARAQAASKQRVEGAEKSRARIEAAQEKLGAAGAPLESLKTLDTSPPSDSAGSVGLLAQAKQKQAQIKALSEAQRTLRGGADLETLPKAAVVAGGAEITPDEAMQQVRHDLAERARQQAMGDLLDLYNAQDKATPLRKSLLAGHNAFFNNAAHIMADQGLPVRGPDPLMADILGPAVVAHVMHRAMSQGSDGNTVNGVTQGLIEHHIATQVKRARDATGTARELFNQADNLKDFPLDSMDNLLAGLDQNQQRLQLTRDGRNIVGATLGQLEAAAALNYAVMGGQPADSAQVSLGGIAMEDAVKQCAAIGLTDPDKTDTNGNIAHAGQYHLYSDGHNIILKLNREGLDALAAQLNEDPAHMQRAHTVAAIKAGEHDEVDWLPDGISRRPAVDVSRDAVTDVPRLDLQLNLADDTPAGALPGAIKEHIAHRIEAGQDPTAIAADLRAADVIATQVPESLQDDYRAALQDIAPTFKATPGQKVTAQDYIDHRARVDEGLRAIHRDYLQQQVKAGKLDAVDASVHEQTLPATDAVRDLLHQVSIQDPRLKQAFKGVGELGRHGRRAVREYAYEHIFRDSAGNPLDAHSEEPIEPLAAAERGAFDKWQELRRGGNPYQAIQKHWAEHDAGEGGMFGPAEPHDFATVDLDDDGAVLAAARRHGDELGYNTGFRNVDLQNSSYSEKYHPELEVTDTQPLEQVATSARKRIMRKLRTHLVQSMAGQPEIAGQFDPDKVATASMRWAEYVADMGGEKRAYAAIMDKMKGDFAGRFAKGYGQTTGHEWKVLNVPVQNGDAHSLAMLPPDTRRAMKARRQSERDRLRNRTQGKYATENASLLEKEAAAKAGGEQQQLVSDSNAQTDQQQLDTHRLTMGTAAENMVRGMLPAVSLKKGTVAAGDIDMSHSDNMKRQRAIKQLEQVGRMAMTLGTGAGKSVIGLAGFSHLKQAGKVKRAMFAVPSSVVEQFGSEAARFYDMTNPAAPKWFADNAATAEQRRAAYHHDSGHDLCVVTHQALRDDLTWALAQHKFGGDIEQAKQFLADSGETERHAAIGDAVKAQGWDFEMSLIDEGHNLLNRQGKENSAMANAIDSFTHDKPFHVSMSADPIKNDACIHPDTPIHDPVRGLTMPVKEWAAKQLAPHVWAVDEGGTAHIKQAGVPFVKFKAPMYRVRTDDGSEIVVARSHKFLTPSGWMALSALAVGDSIACAPPIYFADPLPNASGPALTPTSLPSSLQIAEGLAFPSSPPTFSGGFRGTLAQSHCVLRGSARYCWQKVEDYLSHYSTCCHPCGAQPLPVLGSVQCVAPSQRGVLAHIPSCSPMDDLASIATHSLLATPIVPCSEGGSLRSLSALANRAYGYIQSRVSGNSYAPSRSCNSTSRPSAPALGPGSPIRESVNQPPQASAEFVTALSSGRACVPCSTVYRSIILVDRIEDADIYDLTVPDLHNYLACGIWNHNTEVFSFLSKIQPQRYVDDSEGAQFAHSDGSEGQPQPITRSEFLRKYAVDTPAAMEALQREMEPYHYAESITPDVSKTTRLHEVPMTAPQQEAYNEVLHAYQRVRAARQQGKTDVAALRSLSPGSFKDVPAEQQAAVAERLQASAGILRDAALDRVVNRHPAGAKLAELDRLLKQHPPKDEPAIVFAHNLEAVDMIHDHLAAQGHRVVKVNGTMAAAEREKRKQAFSPQWDDKSGSYVHEPTADVIVYSDAGAEGWNGQRGQQVYHFDTSATAKTHRQREGRAYRIGQRHDVHVHHLLTDSPYERRRRRVLEQKDAMRDALTTPAEMIDDSGLAQRIGDRTRQNRQRLVQRSVADYMKSVVPEPGISKAVPNLKGGIHYDEFGGHRHRETGARIEYPQAQGVNSPQDTNSGGAPVRGTFVARYTNHINDDMKRGWSSWNFGQEGFEGSKSELLAELEQAKADGDRSVWVNGFDIYPETIDERGGDVVVNHEFTLRELHPNYWVVVDTSKGTGLSAIRLKSGDLDSAVEEAKGHKGAWSGPDEDMIDPDEIDHVHSTDFKDGDTQLHVLKLKS